MIRDQPQGAELLAQARNVLTDRVLPNLSAETRYQALMAIRAIELSRRELLANRGVESRLVDQLRTLLDAESTVPELFSLVSNKLRNGDFDASEELYTLLSSVVAFKLTETNPSIAGAVLRGLPDEG